MKKLAVGLLALIVIIGGSAFGAITYGRYRAHAEVEKTFDALRASGREATHGPVGYDLFAGTLTIPDISIRSKDGVRLTIASLLASGISQPTAERVAIKSIDINGISIEATDSATKATSTYAAPRARVEDYAGPVTLMPSEADGGREVLRLALRQLATVSAARITVPEATANVTLSAPGTPNLSTSVTYANLKAEGLANGRIATLAFDRMSFETSAPQGAPDLAMKGRLEGFSAADIDTAPFLALVEKKPQGQGYATVYGRVSATGYALAHGDGTSVAVGAVNAEGLGIDPSAISLDRIDELRALTQRGEALSDEESRRLLLANADLLKAVAFKAFSMKDVAVSDPSGKANVGSIALADFKDGKIATFTITALKGEAQDQKPVTLDKLVISGLTPLPVLEASAKTAPDGTLSALDGALSMFRALDGFEITGLTVPHEDSNVPVTIKNLSANWSQFIGLVPTRFAVKGTGISGPVSEANSLPFAYLADAGMEQATLDLDVALAYDPDKSTLTLSPASTRVEKAFSASLDLQFVQVQRKAFEDPIAALAAAQQIAVGPAKLVVTNLGLADLILKQNAAAAGVEPEALRQEVIAGIQRTGQDLVPAYADAPAIADALVAFVKAPGTLTVVVTPKGDVKLMDLIALDPMMALGNFTITATAAP